MASLIDTLGYHFKDPQLLQRALTHTSFVNEQARALSYERLEFLGDAVLELVVSELLYVRCPGATEGELTRRRAALVCEPSLAALARGLDLGPRVRMGNGERTSGGETRDSMLADVLEAVFGALYMDGGLAPARAFILRLFTPIADDAANAIDPKTSLQEAVQKTSREALSYTLIDESGPPHHKSFTATVSHEGREIGRGTGRSKKEAEQNAAMMALEQYAGQ